MLRNAIVLYRRTITFSYIVSTNQWAGCASLGKGVVGKQPVLGMGEHFEYTSACSLRHLKGTMRGSYTLVSQKSGV